ncbi:AGAP011772-PA-like protein [Anopheles sinensis]|uniref:AGAP011772-PA-like protein n=1 Tax=Anopheles sinensis TaxID=74873 RepID=A0A084WJ57_ANOSI|nr:AGAP011772-PA-like protein [Anopheles sinensis]
MDELMELFDNFIGDALQLEKAMEEEFKEFEKKLNDCVAQANERGTPVQNKKRPKRQVSISEKDESTNSSTRQEEEGTSKQQPVKSMASATSRSTVRMLDVFGNGNNAPVPGSAQQSMETAPIEASFARPSRSAALKAQEKLKEPTLNSKMRNESFTAVIVKKERQSKIEADGKNSAVGSGKPVPQNDQYDEMETENDANYANRNIQHDTQHRKDEGFGSTNESSEKDEPAMATAKPTSHEASIMVVPLVVPKVEVLSDEEMPPPKLPPPKMPAPKVRTKKKATAKDQKLADEQASSSAVSSAESSINGSSSSLNDTQQGARRGRGRPTKASKVVPPPMEEESIEPVRIKTEKLSIVDSNQQQKQESNTSSKSIYEDAQEQMEQHQIRPLQVVLEKIVFPPANRSRASDMNGTFTTGKSQANETYALPPSIQDGTFTVNSPPNTAPCNETFNLPTQGIAHQPQTGTNDTFVIEKTGSASKEHDAAANYHKTLVNASIMTEDDSVVENSPNQAPMLPAMKPKPVVAGPSAKPKKSSASTSVSKKGSSAFPSSSKQQQMKDNNELFNPCIMSPIKSRIQAFEKCASTTTGTLTKATTSIGTPQPRVGRVLKTISTPSLATTPQFSSLESLGSAAHSAQPKETVYTPNCATQPLVKAVSASKIHQMQSKALHSKFGTNATTGCGGTARSLSRESSSDRAQGQGGGSGGGTLSAASSISSLLDEKKKKREEKQRLAAQQREAMEREKREHAERLLREKEEKYRKLVQEKQEKIRLDACRKAKKLEEFEKRRQLEEQRALADQKREALAKQLEQQRIDRELLETLKQSQMKETQETKLHKQMVQQKLRQQQLQQEQQQMAAKKKAAATKKETFKFEMIDTDDTTDDDEAEDVAARKKKRPPTPEWCQNTAEFRKTLTLQAMVDTKVVDRLFSVQPMTPDLRILFPSIDAHKLKRNSSAIWRTPPRQSQIP